VGPDVSKEKRKSRWVKGSDVPRYDERTLSSILNRYHESPGWFRGARVRKA